MSDMVLVVDEGGKDESTYTIVRHGADGTVTIVASGTFEELKPDLVKFMRMMVYVSSRRAMSWHGLTIFNDWAKDPDSGSYAVAPVEEAPAFKKPKPWAADRRAQWRNNQSRHGRKG